MHSHEIIFSAFTQDWADASNFFKSSGDDRYKQKKYLEKMTPHNNYLGMKEELYRLNFQGTRNCLCYLFEFFNAW